MRKILVLAIALMLLVSAGIGEENMDYRIIGGRARVIGAEAELTSAADGSAICTIPEGSHVVLMGEKSDGSFTLVNYDGKSGFVDAQYLDMQLGIGGMGLDKILTADDWYNISSFVTVFTRTQITRAAEGYFSAETCPASVLLTFAADHARLSGSDEAAEDVIAAYFPASAAENCAWEDGGSSEESGAVSGPFAIVDHVSDMEDGTYRVRFNTFGAGADWTDADISLSAKAAQEKFPGDMGYGYAEFSAADLADPSTYRLIEMVYAN